MSKQFLFTTEYGSVIDVIKFSGEEDAQNIAEFCKKNLPTCDLKDPGNAKNYLRGQYFIGVAQVGKKIAIVFSPKNRDGSATDKYYFRDPDYEGEIKNFFAKVPFSFPPVTLAVYLFTMSEELGVIVKEQDVDNLFERLS